LRIGYLMNVYPMTSTTFIRREIQAIEALGQEIRRYAIRPWADVLVDARDRAEQARTHYLLTGKIPSLLAGCLVELISNPVGMARALAAWLRLLRNAGGQLVPHFAYLLEAIALKRVMRQDGIDHLHTHFSTNSASVALLCRRLGGPDFSFTAHGPDEFVDGGRSSLDLKVAEAGFVIAISEFCRTQLVLAAGMQHRDKIHIVKCGVDLTEFPASGLPFGPGAPFVTVGRLCPQKAQVLVVEAAARVAPRHPDLRVLMIGDGESRPDVEQAIAHHSLQDHVLLLGWRDNESVGQTLGQARALLLPSLAEGLPVVIMEAFALGRPVISTFIAGIPELVDDRCGWIVPAGSVEAIAGAMTAALRCGAADLTAMGAEGQRRVAAAHDVHVNAKVLLGLMTAHGDASARG
jgi:colanic acid/amylovoran biosynthesis glycosyltransferase